MKYLFGKRDIKIHRTNSIKNTHSPRQAGFTIVELLIVIVVIGILAAIVLVAYNGITNRAIETSMKSDLRNASKVLDIDKQNNGVYPLDSSSASNGGGLKSSGDSVLSYSPKSSGYCIGITNPRTPMQLRLKNTDGQISDGTCDAAVSTFAGSGTSGFADGSASTARFYFPRGIATDAEGNVYVAEVINNRIRKITPSGDVSTFAGSGSSGSANGTGVAAQFSSPVGVAVDAQGYVYVADLYNASIRKITPAGVVSTLTASGIVSPMGVAVDSSGTVYVSDDGDSRIKKVSPSGVVTTLAGSGTAGFANGTGAAAQFDWPMGLAVDSLGNVYVSDASNHRIRKISPSGVVTTLAGSGTGGYVNGAAGIAQFNYPRAVTLDALGNIYVADNSNNRIRKVTSGGEVSTTAGSGANGSANGASGIAQFSSPSGIAIDSFGDLYIADLNNNRIRKIEL